MVTRNEKGRFTTEEASASYGYYSKLLKKPFDTLDELKAAEDEYNKAHEAEIKAKEERKIEAEAVKAAIVARINAEEAAKQAKKDAYEAFLKACDAADEKLAQAKKAEHDKLVEFCKKHPEGYHDTIKIGDVTYTCNYNTKGETSYMDPFVRLLNWF